MALTIETASIGYDANNLRSTLNNIHNNFFNRIFFEGVRYPN